MSEAIGTPLDRSGRRLKPIRAPLLIAVVTTIIGLVLVVMPPGAVGPEQGRAAGLALIVIGLWATALLPEHLTSLLFFLLAMLWGVAPSRVIFSGFASSAFWMIFAGLVIALAVRSTGLSERIAHSIAIRLDRGYAGLISGMVAVGIVLGFLMPSSMARVVLLVPVTIALAEAFGFEVGSKGRTGLVMAATFGTFVPAFAILPANIPNMVLVGSAETQFDIAPLYGEYLLLHFPVLGLAKSAVIVGLILWRYPDQPKPYTQRKKASAPLSWAEWEITGVLVLALAFWMSDFLHHISPAWIALAAALFLLMPRVGLVSPGQFNSEINFSSLFFVAGVLGLGAFISYTGVGAHLAAGMTDILPLQPGQNFLNYFSLTLTAMAAGVVTTLPGVPAVLTPLAEQLAQASGLPIKTV